MYSRTSLRARAISLPAGVAEVVAATAALGALVTDSAASTGASERSCGPVGPGAGVPDACRFQTVMCRFLSLASERMHASPSLVRHPDASFCPQNPVHFDLGDDFARRQFGFEGAVLEDVNYHGAVARVEETDLQIPFGQLYLNRATLSRGPREVRRRIRYLARR